MDRVLLVVGAVAIAGVVAVLLGRHPAAAPADNTHHVPRRLDRADFARPDTPWLVAVFTSATCDTCAGVLQRASLLESDQVAVQEVEMAGDAALHERYRVDAVPMLLLVDGQGEVQRALLGPVTSAELWAAVAEARDLS